MTVAAHLLRLRDPDSGEPLPDDLLAGEFGVFFGAGVETSGNAISWTVYAATPLAHPCVVEAERRIIGLRTFRVLGLGLGSCWRASVGCPSAWAWRPPATPSPGLCTRPLPCACACKYRTSRRGWEQCWPWGWKALRPVIHLLGSENIRSCHHLPCCRLRMHAVCMMHRVRRVACCVVLSALVCTDLSDTLLNCAAPVNHPAAPGGVTGTGYRPL